MKDFEETTAFLGHWGRFQQIIFFLLFASIVPNGFILSPVFVADIPKHHCFVPEDNLTPDWHNASIPIKVVDGGQELSRCSRYRLDVVRNLSAQGLVPGRDVNLTDVEQEGCVDGWSYSRDVYQSTIVSEFDLVCSDHWKQPFTSTVFFLGVLVGSFISGHVSDRFGRKPVLFVTMAIQSLFTLFQIFSPSWVVFCILFFISGLGQASNYLSGFVLGTEILTGNARIMFSSMGVCLGYATGYMLLPLVAYFLRDWKSLLLALSVPGLAYILLWWMIPESPLWLLSQGRVEEAEAVVRKAAKINKVQPPPVIFRDFTAHKNTSHQKHYNVVHMLRKRNIRSTTIILCLVWLTLSTGYYGLSLNTSQLHADPYISCFISAVVEIPAYITSWLALKYLPRRLSAICVLLVSSSSLFFIQLIPQRLYWVSFALEMLGKFAITTGTSLMYVYTAELYPTVIRNTATGTCNTVSRIGSCTAPFLLKLRIYFKYLPYVIFGTMGVLSAFAALFLPETFRRPLPQTIQEMQKRERIKHPFISKKQHPASAAVIES
ncbi:organic cation/carnitine transporter 2-like [Antennarius striatus]|uniref:organic cation/carnitine transporter 2-like n=1 Tax=Antennarius striatus TaxID=241820 RepID=UPI0035B1CC6A